MKHKFKQASQFLSSICPKDVAPYLRYWAGLMPQRPRDFWLRWIFAYMSIHTTWECNVRGYLTIANLHEAFSRKQLSTAIKKSGTGLYHMRTKGIWDFTQRFQQTPKSFTPELGEKMVPYRDRLAKELYGIGMAKTSFVFEMLLS